MSIQRIQASIQKAIQMYSIESEAYDTATLVAFISVEVYKELNDLNPAPAPVTSRSSHSSSVKTVESPKPQASTRRQATPSSNPIIPILATGEVSSNEEGGKKQS